MDATALVRIVADRTGPTTVVTPDLRRTLPGRGAHLHPTTRCLELATRRKAFARALRLEGPVDLHLLEGVVTGPEPEDPPINPESEHPLMDHR